MIRIEPKVNGSHTNDPPISVMKLQSGSNNEPPDPGAQERLSMGDRSGTETSPDSMMIQENELRQFK